MYELLLVACIGFSGCDTVKSPILYASEERCGYQAAILAGITRAHAPSGRSMTYEFSCTPAGSRAEAWTLVLPGKEEVVLHKVQ